MKLSSTQFIRLAGAFSVVTVAATHASASIIYDNLSAVSGGTALVSASNNGPLADSFSTGSVVANLIDVKLLLDASNPSDGGTFTVTLLRDNSISPGSVLDSLGVFNDSSLTSTLTPFDITLATPFALAANTRYWIEISGTAASTTSWSFDQTNVGTGVAAEYNYYAGAVAANSAFTPYQMQITDSATTPEPATWSLIIMAGVGLVLRRQKFHAR